MNTTQRPLRRLEIRNGLGKKKRLFSFDYLNLRLVLGLVLMGLMLLSMVGVISADEVVESGSRMFSSGNAPLEWRPGSP